MAAPSPRTSSGVGGLPTPKWGDCAASVAAPAQTTTSARTLRINIGHRPIGLHSPELDPVEVIDGVAASRSDQLFARRLDVAGLVNRARCDDGFPALEAPGHPEARQCDRQ